MKRMTFIATCLALLMVLSTFALAQGRGTRVFVQSGNGAADGLLRATFGVTHNFDNGFTTELTSGQLQALERLAGRLGITVEPVPLWHVSAPPGACSPWPACKDSEPDPDPTPPSREFFPSDQTPWGIELIYNDPSIASTSGGVGVDVAVLDTGVFKDHLDLSRRVSQCKDFTKGPRVKKGCDDAHGHGTHVSGTVLADGGEDGKGIFGVASEANLFAYKVCGNDGSCWSDDIAKAIETAADNGAEIISMSLGGDSESILVRDAITYANSKGVLIVAAAGNDGPADGSIDWPGANADVIAVGAIDASLAVADWSSRGVNDGDFIVEVKEVEFGAPGVSVLSTFNNGGYALGSGTSMATPHVAGLAAKFWQGSAASTRTYLQGLASDIWTAGDDTATGFGLPQVPTS